MRLAKTDLHAGLAIFFGVSTIAASLSAESPIQSAPAIETTLRISTSRFQKRTSLVRQEGGCSAARSAVLRRPRGLRFIATEAPKRERNVASFIVVR